MAVKNFADLLMFLGLMVVGMCTTEPSFYNCLTAQNKPDHPYYAAIRHPNDSLLGQEGCAPVVTRLRWPPLMPRTMWLPT